MNARFSTLLILTGALRPCVDYHLPAISRMAWYCWSYQFFLFRSFIPLIFSCLSIVQKHLAQTCGFITLADSQTFYQISVFSSKTHSLQTQKYDVSMTSVVAMNT